MAISRARIVELFFRSSKIMNHFGINPVRGGRPPVDIKIIDRVGRRIGILFHRRDKEEMEVDE